jgi:uncharacterized protein with von Willebrand factor type A (vWA) domain
MSAPVLLRGVDLAAFAVALVARLRAAGVVVSASGPAAFVQALRRLVPRYRAELYWAARLTLINRVDDLAAFDAVFDAAFADAVLGTDPPARHQRRSRTPAAAGSRADHGRPVDGGGAPWRTRPSVTAAGRNDTSAGRALAVPDLLPSRIVVRADEPFDRFDADDLRLLGSWLEQAMARWPRRRSMRRELNRNGKRVDLRRTMNASRATGWESMVLARTRPRRRTRRVVLVCDVSRSMQPYATIYLHLMRATALRRGGIRPEVFAFSTSLTRLTPILSHHSAEVALTRANAKVADRYGGTHLGRSVGALLGPPHGHALRGAVVIIASDGWDSDPPEVLVRALTRVRRRAELVVWLNPRAAQEGFQPLAGSMAAALPMCDLFLPAHSLTGLRDLFCALAA